MVHFVTMRVRVKSAGVLVYDEKDQFFKLLNLRGYPAHDRSSSRGYVLSRTDPLIGYLAEEKSPLEIEQVKEACRNLTPSPSATPQRRSRLNVTYVSGGKGKSAGDYDFSQIRLRMEELKASCLVPSFLADNLKNVLVLGEKKSGDPYTEEDLNVLFTLAQESAIAIENARLYDQAIERTKELEKINTELNSAQNELIQALSKEERSRREAETSKEEALNMSSIFSKGRYFESL